MGKSLCARPMHDWLQPMHARMLSNAFARALLGMSGSVIKARVMPHKSAAPSASRDSATWGWLMRPVAMTGMSTRDLIAPQHLHVEASNVLRRAQLAGQLDSTAASLAFQDLRRLPVRTVPFDPLADRVWALRANLTAYDAAYVAAAEALDAPLATLDMTLVNSPGPACAFAHP